jgi:hypothetical protein
MSGGSVSISGRLVAWLGAAALAALSAGAAGALGTYNSVTEMRVEVRALAARVATVEQARSKDDDAKRLDAGAIDTRLRAVESGLARVQTTLELLVARR